MNKDSMREILAWEYVAKDAPVYVCRHWAASGLQALFPYRDEDNNNSHENTMYITLVPL